MDESDLRAWVAAWPGVEDSVKWEDDLVFSVVGKMFCVMCLRGSNVGSMSFKVEDHRFLELSEQPGFIPAPYLARAHWGEGGRLRDALKRIACPTERPAMDGRAGARRHGWLLATTHYRFFEGAGQAAEEGAT